jgi:hypothetical protein
VTIVRRSGTAERTFFLWADGMKMRAKKDIHPGKKKKRMDARAEIGCCGLIFAYTHTSTPPDNAPFARNGAVFPFQSGSVSFGRQGRFVVFAASLSGGQGDRRNVGGDIDNNGFVHY